MAMAASTAKLNAALNVTLAATLSDLAGPARSRLLHALRARPDAGLHVRELAKVAGLSLSSVQRELERFSTLGVVERRHAGNRVLVRLKRGDPFARLLVAADVALDLRGSRFEGMPVDRDQEKRLVDLCAHMPPDAALWREYGDAAFLAGLAVLLAGHSGFDRHAYLALAETLYPGKSTLASHEAWRQKHRPQFARLFAMIDRERRTHAPTHDQ